MLAAKAESMFSEALANVTGLTHVERSAVALQNVDEDVVVDRFGAGNLVRHPE